MPLQRLGAFHVARSVPFEHSRHSAQVLTSTRGSIANREQRCSGPFRPFLGEFPLCACTTESSKSSMLHCRVGLKTDQHQPGSHMLTWFSIALEHFPIVRPTWDAAPSLAHPEDKELREPEDCGELRPCG